MYMLVLAHDMIWQFDHLLHYSIYLLYLLAHDMIWQFDVLIALQYILAVLAGSWIWYGSLITYCITVYTCYTCWVMIWDMADLITYCITVYTCYTCWVWYDMAVWSLIALQYILAITCWLMIWYGSLITYCITVYTCYTCWLMIWYGSLITYCITVYTCYTWLIHNMIWQVWSLIALQYILAILAGSWYDMAVWSAYCITVYACYTCWLMIWYGSIDHLLHYSIYLLYLLAHDMIWQFEHLLHYSLLLWFVRIYLLYDKIHFYALL